MRNLTFCTYLQHPTLTTINLRKCTSVTDAGVAKLREDCPQLASIDLFGCFEVTDYALALLIAECKDLQPENIQSSSKGDLYCDSVARHCQNLTKVDLRQSDVVTDKGLAILMEHFPGLIEVNLDECSQVHKLDS